MSFFAYCSKTNNQPIILSKFTFDKSSYYQVPESDQNLDNHHLIKNSKNANFSKLNIVASGYRHVKLPLKDKKGNPSKEAETYIKDGKFVINNKILELVSNQGK